MALRDVLKQAKTKKARDTIAVKLQAQQDIAVKLQASETLGDLLAKASEMRQLLDADWVFVWAFVDGMLVTRDPGGEEIRVPVDAAGIPGHVARTGEDVNIVDVYDDKELRKVNPSLSFNRAADEASGYRTKNVLCCPVVFRNNVIGVIQAINKLTSDQFDFIDQEAAGEMARSLGPLMFQVIELDRQGRMLKYQENLNKIINAIHAARDIDQILISLVGDILGLFACERVTVYAVDPEKNELFSRNKSGNDIKEYRVKINTKSISGYVADTRNPVSIVDVYDDDELSAIHPQLSFNRSFDEMTGFRTKEVLAVPIEFQGDLLGALQLINSTSGSAFDESDMNSAKSLAETLGIAFNNQTRAGLRRTKYEALVENNVASSDQIKRARQIAKEESVSVEAALMNEYGISKKAILEAYGEFFRVFTFEYDPRMVVPQEIIAKVSDRYDDFKFAKFVPLEGTDRKVVVGIDDPKDVVKRDHIQAMFAGRRIEYRVGLVEDVVQAIDLFFGAGGDGESVSDLLSQMEEEGMEESFDETDDSEANEDDSAVVKLVNRIIEDAYRRGASDIHIEPGLDGESVVRYRVDGSMQKVMTFPRAYRNALLSRIKIMSDLDIAERRKPQSGKIKFKKWGKLDIELRVECVPTVGGTEDAVMRILAASKPMPVAKMSMSKRNEEEFLKVIEQPYGIFLCVGPTGSGKTTTLHSALGHINREDTKIWTAEDPVEITQKGLRQVQMNRKAGLTFASAMRSFLRADPDVIMIGEMRDSETAETGVEASLTGHMVLSTLHTNSAPETVTRLLDMGIDPYSFADALLAILAQRLVRTLCKSCKEERELTEEDIALLRDEYGDPELFDELGAEAGHKIYQAHEGGCAKCSNVGYRGRMGIHELLVCNDDIKLLIYRKAKAMEIRDLAIQQGMRTLKQDGIAKILKGFTALEEVRAVCTR